MLEVVPFVITQMRKGQWQTVIIIIGMTLAVAFSVGITTIVSAVNEDFNETKRGPSRVDLTIQKRDASFYDYSDLRAHLKQVKGIKLTSPAIIISFNSSTFTRTNESFIVKIMGIDPESHPDLSRINLLSGEANISLNQIIVSQALLSKLAVKEGTVFEALGHQFVVSGIIDVYRQRTFSRLDTTNLIIINIDYLRDILDVRENLITTTFIEVKNILDVEQVKDELSIILRDDFEVIQQVSITSVDKLAISSYGTTMASIILITIFVEFIFLVNLFLITVNNRQTTIGLLRSLGLSKNKLLIAFLLEILFYGLVSTLLGLLAGHLLATTMIKHLLETKGLKLTRPLSLRPSDLIFAMGSGLGVGFLAAIYPTFLMLRLNISSTLNERRILFTEMKANLPPIHVLMTFIGVVMILAATLTYQQSKNKILSIRLESIPIIISFFLALLLLIITTFLALMIISVLNQLVKSFSRFLILHIATRNILRYRIRSFASLLTNGLAFAFTLVILILTASLGASVPSWFQDSYPNVDMIVKIEQKSPLSFQDLPKIQKVHQNIEQVISIETIKALYTQQNLVFDINVINATIFEKFGPALLQGEGYQALAASEQESDEKQGVNALISRNIAETYQVVLGDTLVLNVIDQNLTIYLRIIGVVEDSIFSPSTNPFQLFVDHDSLTNLLKERNFPLNYIFITLKDKRIVEEVRIAIIEQVPNVENIIIVQDYLKTLEKAIDRQKTLLQSLSIQAFFIAIITQFIAILLSIEKSRREIGLLRAMGLSSGAAFTLFLVEGIVLSGLGIGVGVINGSVGAIIVSWYIQQVARPLPLVFNLIEIGKWLLLYALLMTSSIIFPAIKISEMVPIEALDERPRLLSRKRPLYYRFRRFSLTNLTVLSFWAFLYIVGQAILPVALEIIPIPNVLKETFQMMLFFLSIGFMTIGILYLFKINVLALKPFLLEYQHYYDLDKLGTRIFGKTNVMSNHVPSHHVEMIFPRDMYIPWHFKLQILIFSVFKKGTIKISHLLDIYRRDLKKIIQILLLFINVTLFLSLLHLLDDPVTFMIKLRNQESYLTLLMFTILLIILTIILIAPLTSYITQITWNLEQEFHPVIHFLALTQARPLLHDIVTIILLIITRIALKNLLEPLIPSTYSILFLDCFLAYLFHQLAMNAYYGLYESLLTENHEKLQ